MRERVDAERNMALLCASSDARSCQRGCRAQRPHFIFGYFTLWVSFEPQARWCMAGGQGNGTARHWRDTQCRGVIAVPSLSLSARGLTAPHVRRRRNVFDGPRCSSVAYRRSISGLSADGEAPVDTFVAAHSGGCDCFRPVYWHGAVRQLREGASVLNSV